MTNLILSASFFLGIHLLISGTKIRDTITTRIGEQAYLGLFSLASLGGLVWMCLGYASSPTIELWAFKPAMWTFAAVVTMPVAFFLAVVGLTTPNPTAVGAERLVDGDDPVRGILRITRHPFLWGAGIWAATHLVANGDLASLIFFGAFLVLTASGTRAIDRKRARTLGPKWQTFSQSTSNLPFAAITSGRNMFVPTELLSWRLAAAVLAYALVYLYHASLFG